MHLSLCADVAATDETPAQENGEAERQAAAAEPEAARSIRHEPVPTSKWRWA